MQRRINGTVAPSTPPGIPAPRLRTCERGSVRGWGPREITASRYTGKRYACDAAASAGTHQLCTRAPVAVGDHDPAIWSTTFRLSRHRIAVADGCRYGTTIAPPAPPRRRGTAPLSPARHHSPARERTANISAHAENVERQYINPNAEADAQPEASFSVVRIGRSGEQQHQREEFLDVRSEMTESTRACVEGGQRAGE